MQDQDRTIAQSPITKAAEPNSGHRALNRRHFLHLTGGGVSALMLAACGQTVGMIAPSGAVQASSATALAPTSTSASAANASHFGRMFPALAPALFDQEPLLKLADLMIAPLEANDQGKLQVTPEDELDDEENFGLPAGYTYFGQFVDHDLTFDPRSSLVILNNPTDLTNFRTAAFDLDALYGHGPDEQPYMYTPDGRKFLLGDRSLTGALRDNGPIQPLTQDLPRFRGRAIIGDKRNDENVIVSQLHGLFLRFHNGLADSYPDRSFAEIQRLVRWHYQWLVLFDYLPRIIGRDQVLALLPHLANKSSIALNKPNLQFFNWQTTASMPIEFSGAAYRFGHSLVRPVYRLSAADLRSSVTTIGMNGRRALFSPNPNDGLNGFQAFAAENGIDWRLFFETRDHRLSATLLGKGRVQPSYKIDTSLVTALGFLPEFSKTGTNVAAGAPNTNSLSYRNLQRGVTLQLPSGQAIARAMGLEPMSDQRLLVGKANTDGLTSNKTIVEVDARFSNNAPLWYYILAEAQDQWRKATDAQPSNAQKEIQPTLLGPVGGRIVGEVLIGLIAGDDSSFLSDPTWQPLFGDPQAASIFDRFTMGDLTENI
jgi:hypothetical protein